MSFLPTNPHEPAYLLKLLQRCSDYFNGERSFTNQQVQHLAATLKAVLAEARPVLVKKKEEEKKQESLS